MYRTIIAGCNGRECGRGAVSLAHAVSVATGARHRRRLRRIVESDQALHGAPCAAAPDRHASCPVLVVPRRADPEHADALLAGLVVTAR
jgi:hypothetical protein